MKKATLYILFMIYTLFSFSQEMVKNGGFENTKTHKTRTICTNGIFNYKCNCYEGLLCKNPDNIISCNNNFDRSPFSLRKLEYWQCAHGSPQVEMIGCTNPIVASGNISAFIDGSQNNIEGIFQDGINLEIGTMYTISFNVRNIGFELYLTDGLKNDTVLSGAIIVPNPSSKEKLYPNNTPDETFTPIGNGWIHVEIKNYVVKTQQTQLWILSTANDNIIDDISITKACCVNQITYEYTINPPNTHVNDWIHVNPSVTSNVEYNIPTQRNWTARNNINIKNNFKVSSQTSFNAKLIPCADVLMDVDISFENIPNHATDCEYLISSNVCMGSGNYSYEWYVDGQFYSNNASIVLNMTQGHHFKLKVTDLIQNTVVEREIDIGPCGCPTIDLASSFPNNTIQYCPELNGQNCFTIGAAPSPLNNVSYSWACNDPTGNCLNWLSNQYISNPLLCIPPNTAIPQGLQYYIDANININGRLCQYSDIVNIECCLPTIDLPSDIILCGSNCYQVNINPVTGYTYQWIEVATTCPNISISSKNIANPLICFLDPALYNNNYCYEVTYRLIVTNACGDQVTKDITIRYDDLPMRSGCSDRATHIDYIVAQNKLRCNLKLYHGAEYLVKTIVIKIYDQNYNEIGSQIYQEGVNFSMPNTNSFDLWFDNIILNCNGTYYIEYFYRTQCGYFNTPFIHQQDLLILNCI